MKENHTRNTARTLVVSKVPQMSLTPPPPPLPLVLPPLRKAAASAASAVLTRAFPLRVEATWSKFQHRALRTHTRAHTLPAFVCSLCAPPLGADSCYAEQKLQQLLGAARAHPHAGQRGHICLECSHVWWELMTTSSKSTFLFVSDPFHQKP